MFGEPFWFFSHYGEIERGLSSLMIACAMIGMGASLALRDFARVFVVWRGFAIGMVLQIVLVPVCAGAFIALLALAVPLYPRADGAALETADFAAPGTEPLTDETAKPFAALSALRERMKKN